MLLLFSSIAIFIRPFFLLSLASTLLKDAVAALRVEHSETQGIVKCNPQQRTLEAIQSNLVALLMKKLRFREVKYLAQGHIAGKRYKLVFELWVV